MSSYADIDGLPASADPWLFTDVLRDEWGFGGTVVSDYWAVPFLASMHRVAADNADAGVVALTTGTDVELPDTIGFAGLLDKVKSGDVSEDLIDRAARRLLLQKIELGLLDPGWTPEGSVRAGGVDLDSAENRAIAQELAEKSVVLLDAGSALPLSRELTKVAVVGPCAGDARTMIGVLRVPEPCPAAVSRPRSRRPGDHPDRCPAQRTVRRGSPACEGLRGHGRGPLRLHGGGRGGAPRTFVSRTSATCPDCSATAPRAKGVTPRTCGCPGSRPTCSTRCSTAAHRSWSWWSRVVPMRSADRGSGRRPGAGVHSRPGGGRRDGRRPQWADRAEWQAAGADPTARRWAARYLPAAGSRQRGEYRHQRPRGPATVPLRVRRVVHEFAVDDLRLSATEIGNDGEFTATVRVQTPVNAPATRSSSCICVMWWRGWRGR